MFIIYKLPKTIKEQFVCFPLHQVKKKPQEKQNKTEKHPKPPPLPPTQALTDGTSI